MAPSTSTFRATDVATPFQSGSLLWLAPTLASLALSGACHSSADSKAPDPAGPERSSPDGRIDGPALLGEWTLESIDGVDVLELGEPYLVFEPDGSVHGAASVNRLMGTWSWEGDRLELSPLATTLMAGHPTLMDQEQRLLAALERVNGARIDRGGFLELVALGGTTLIRARPRPAGPVSKLTGSVIYRERIALRPGHRLEVVLLDVSRADAASEILGRVEADVVGQVPIPFELAYDPARLQPRHRYALRASLRDEEGRLAWTTTEVHSFDAGAPDSASIELLVERVP